MKQKERPSIRYSIWDPSGNITALAEMETLMPGGEVAAQIMKKHPEVEQVGFVRDITPPEEGIRAELFMAGGEFCGNATMCAAAWYAERNRNADAPEQELYLNVSGTEEAVKIHLRKEEEGSSNGNGRTPDVPEQELYLKVSGAEEAVKVHLQKEEAGVYSGSVRMPAATGITYVRLQYGEVQGTLPLVRMQGISHLIIEEESAFFRFLKERERAEAMVRDQAEKRELEGLGLMFLKKQGAEYSLTPPVQKQEAEYSLTPLVYIRTAGTLFWENSCGSGSSACGIYLAEKGNQPVDLKLVQPGGVLCVRGDLQTGIRLSGRVKKTGEYKL